MLEELIVFGIVLIVSLSARCLASNSAKQKLGIVHSIFLRLNFIGVVVHEISHYIMNLLVGIKPESIGIRWRNKQTHERNPHGWVKSKPRSFLQASLICLAPLYISTWLCFWLLQVSFDSNFTPVLRIIAAIFSVSVILGAAPSGTDFNNIPRAFRDDPFNSLYQIFLILISGTILWLILNITQVVFILDFFYYMAIAGLYFALKYCILGGKTITRIILSRNFGKPSKVRIKKDLRRQYKPKKPHTKW
jgi:hypothetical protein